VTPGAPAEYHGTVVTSLFPSAIPIGKRMHTTGPWYPAPPRHSSGLSTSVSSVARRTAAPENGHGAVRPSSHRSTWSV